MRGESKRMKRVVEALPDAEEMAACGLTKKDFRVDAETYRHFADRDFEIFLLHFRPPESRKGNAVSAPAAEGKGGAPLEGMSAEEREARLAAFEESQPPYHYQRGVFYRCRVDRSGRADRPILLDGYEREEVTGLLGIPPGPYHRNILLELFTRIGDRLRGRKKRMNTGKEPQQR
jgi:hypothetical protein